MTEHNRSYGLSHIERSMVAVNLEWARRKYMAEFAVNSGMWTKEVAEAVYDVKLGPEYKGNSK